jgi:hypothetical protein
MRSAIWLATNVEVVEELDSHNLGVGALQGDILLVDLKLRPDALVSSHIQSFTLPEED